MHSLLHFHKSLTVAGLPELPDPAFRTLPRQIAPAEEQALFINVLLFIGAIEEVLHAFKGTSFL
jgi:hypothetical protein